MHDVYSYFLLGAKFIPSYIGLQLVGISDIATVVMHKDPSKVLMSALVSLRY